MYVPPAHSSADQQMFIDPVDLHESFMERSWPFTRTDEHIKLIQAFVAFEREIRRGQRKAQLRQKRRLADQAGATLAYSQSSYTWDRQVAALMADHQATIARQPI